MKWKEWSLAVDRVTVEARAKELAGRSIKKSSKLHALHTLLRCMDLTTLEGADTEGSVTALCRKALLPNPAMPELPAVAAVCVYPNQVPIAKKVLSGSSVKVASVATGFPSGQVPLSAKIADTEQALAWGADEVDMVISRGVFLEGNLDTVAQEIREIKAVCKTAPLKVILETGELGSLETVRKASLLAMECGADFIKTSTGKVAPAATLPVAMVMMEAIRDYCDVTGKKVGLKPAGGIRTSKLAITYLVMVHEVLGESWMVPNLFRVGASALMNDVLMQIAKETTGVYQSAPYFPLWY